MIKLLAWSTTAGASSTLPPRHSGAADQFGLQCQQPRIRTGGLQAWGTTLHPLPVSGYTTTETPFSIGTLSPAELAHIATTCEFNQINGSGTSANAPVAPSADNGRLGNRERIAPEVLLSRYTCSVSSIDIGKLNSEERLRLLEELWESLTATPEAIPLTNAQREELDRRLDDLDHDVASALFSHTVPRLHPPHNQPLAPLPPANPPHPRHPQIGNQPPCQPHQPNSSAARANGAKSHGPKTSEGKLASSRNALTHGLTARTVVLQNESAEDYQTELRAYLDHFLPQGKPETDLVHQLAAAQWRLARYVSVEAALLEQKMDDQADWLQQKYGDDEFEALNEHHRLAIAFEALSGANGSLALLNRYQARLHREYQRLLKTLTELQAARLAARINFATKTEITKRTQACPRRARPLSIRPLRIRPAPASDTRRMDLSKHCIVRPGTKIRLNHRDPADTFGKQRDDKAHLKTLTRLRELQHLLYADRRYALLIVLQGLDASGKDGTIRHVMSGVNPQGCDVTSFKAPSNEELAHDYLWRVHKAVPNSRQHRHLQPLPL